MKLKFNTTVQENLDRMMNDIKGLANQPQTNQAQVYELTLNGKVILKAQSKEELLKQLVKIP